MDFAFDALVFDLDGTLWDSSQNCAQAWNAALRERGDLQREVTASDVRQVTGLPFAECVARICRDRNIQLDPQLLQRIDQHEKCYLQQHGAELYAGVRQGLAQLSKQYSLFLVSNCQSWYLETFFDHSSMRPFFSGATCHGHDGLGKSDMLTKLCCEQRLKSPVYVGDTRSDQQACVHAGIPFVHARYGFGAVQDTFASVDSFPELVNLLIGDPA